MMGYKRRAGRRSKADVAVQLVKSDLGQQVLSIQAAEIEKQISGLEYQAAELRPVPRSVARVVRHWLDAGDGAPSPFVEHIKEITSGGPLRVACPYVTLRVFETLFSAADWRLLTDIEELLRSQAGDRNAWLAFLHAHGPRVRHCDGLHAKVVAGSRAALVGSANLTVTGLCRHHEVGVVIHDAALVRDLHDWFDDLWIRCDGVTPSDLRAFVASLDAAPPPPAPVTRLPSTSPRIAVALPARTESAARRVEPGTEIEARLVGRFAEAVSRDWINAYLDVCGDLLRELGIDGDDPRLAMTVTTSGKLTTHLNGREVLCAFARGRRSVGVLLPSRFQLPDGFGPTRVDGFDFRGSGAPSFAYFEVESPRNLTPIREARLEGARTQATNGSASPYRRHHVPELHCAVTDREYRRALFDRAFGRRRAGNEP